MASIVPKRRRPNWMRRGALMLQSSGGTGSFAAQIKTDTELFEVLDEDMRPVGTAERLVVHTQGLLHQSTHVFLVREDTQQVLIQKRSEKKRIGPNQWDLSCAEHLQPGESQLDAAVRGMKEELDLVIARDRVKSIRPVKLFRRSFTYQQGVLSKTFHDNEFIECFRCTISDKEAGSIKFCEDEVSEVRFISKEKLIEEMKDRAAFTDWFHEEMNLCAQFL